MIFWKTVSNNIIIFEKLSDFKIILMKFDHNGLIPFTLNSYTTISVFFVDSIM